nr:RRXRR domain-containing protein [Nostoc sp. FACHB-152]
MQTNYVFLVDTNKQPLNPIHSARARELLNKNKAAIYRQFPFTLVQCKIPNYQFEILYRE